MPASHRLAFMNKPSKISGRLSKLTFLSFLILLLSVSVGCNSGQLATFPVEGSVKFEDGTFPRFGAVEFYNAKHEINARGKIQRDGTFTVGTYGEDDGAVEGTHQIVLIQVTGSYLTAKLADQIKHDHGDLISTTYFDYRTSELECTITSDGPNKVELEVKKNPKQTEDGMPKI